MINMGEIMNRKRVYRISIAVVIVVIALLYYQVNYSKSGIYKNVMNQKGYLVTEIQKPITFTALIKSEWFPKEENKENKLNIELAKIGQVGIKIESIIDRGNDIYFTFDDNPYIKYKEGEFISSFEINGDGTFTTYSLNDAFTVLVGTKEVKVGQTGIGPDSKFGFGISKDDLETIKNGFTLIYKGSVYYKYTKN
jgi:hypothetical protein